MQKNLNFLALFALTNLWALS